jgi:hypothetical protein
MANSQPIYIHQDTLVAGLKALLMAHSRSGIIAKEDSYSCGYRDGFEASLDSIAHLVGASDEFNYVKTAINTSHGDRIIIPGGQSTD